MHALPLGRSSLAQTVLVSLLTLVAVALLGAVLAYWTWAWFAPRAEPRVEPTPALSGSVASAGGIFGKVARAQAAAPTGIAIKLLGVVAASGGRRGYAVVQLEAKDILAVHEGADIAPGVRLAEVQPEQVLLERNGVRETLAWPQKIGSVPRSPQAAVSTPPQAAVSVPPQTAQPTVPRTGGSRRRRDGND